MIKRVFRSRHDELLWFTLYAAFSLRNDMRDGDGGSYMDCNEGADCADTAFNYAGKTFLVSPEEIHKAHEDSEVKDD